MRLDLDAIFHPEKKLINVCLSDNSPCKHCAIHEEYEIKALYGNIAERQYAELPESCDTCMKRINWLIDCLTKLAWYERNDERLKKTGDDQRGAAIENQQ